MCVWKAMYRFYSRVRALVEFPNLHHPDVSIDVYSRDFVRFTSNVVSECDIWYIVTKRAGCQVLQYCQLSPIISTGMGA